MLIIAALPMHIRRCRRYALMLLLLPFTPLCHEH